MKRFLLVVLCAALVVPAVFVAGGCGGDGSEAMGYVNNAKKYIDQVRPKADKLGEEMQNLSKNKEVYKSSAAFKKKQEELTKLEASVEAAIEKANKEYARAEKLKLPADVQEYIDLQKQIFELLSKLYKGWDDYLALTAKVLVDEEAGKPVDEVAYTKAIGDIAESIKEIPQKLSDLIEKRDDLYKTL